MADHQAASTRLPSPSPYQLSPTQSQQLGGGAAKECMLCRGDLKEPHVICGKCTCTRKQVYCAACAVRLRASHIVCIANRSQVLCDVRLERLLETSMPVKCPQCNSEWSQAVPLVSDEEEQEGGDDDDPPFKAATLQACKETLADSKYIRLEQDDEDGTPALAPAREDVVRAIRDMAPTIAAMIAKTLPRRWRCE